MPLLNWLVNRMGETNECFFQSQIAFQRLADKMEIERLRALSEMVPGSRMKSIPRSERLTWRRASCSASSLRKRLPRYPGPRDHVNVGRCARSRKVDPARNRLTQDFKKISAGQLSDKKERFDLLGGLQEITHLASIDMRNATIEVQVVNRLSTDKVMWLGYYGFLSQAILNLLSNSLRYACPNGTGGKVDITVDADNAKTIPSFILTVRDFGVGIAPENLPKVFEPFFTTRRILGGTGLGLAIFHNIVTSVFKGTIDVTSTPGQGTAVQIVFPQEILD